MIMTTFVPPHDLPVISLVVKDGKLITLDWFDDKTANLFEKLASTAQSVPCQNLNQADKNHAIALQAITELSEYFVGKRQQFTIPLKFYGTPFQQEVWQALCQIPYGQTISYKALAENIGKPTAFRACANANGKNPISLIVPCHRVIASDGSLGGYTGGVAIKKTLLKLEGISF